MTTVLLGRPVSAGARGRRMPWGAAIAAALLALLVSMALVPGLWTAQDPLAADPSATLQPPSWAHPFGTDHVGRDVFTRVVHGARSTLLLGVGATAIGVALGSLIGVLAGFSGGVLERVTNRIIDVLYSFPDLLLALVVVAILGAGSVNVLVALGIGAIPGYARVLRSQVLQVRASSYVESAVAIGKQRWVIAFAHVLPNSIGPLLVLATVGIGTAIIFGSSLSFVGLGAQPPTPEWGLMLAEARNYLSLAWWLFVWPGVFIVLTVVACTVLGRYLQRTFVTVGAEQ